MYKRILLAVDGSDNSLRAADEAIKIASTNENSVVELLYIVDFYKLQTYLLQTSRRIALEHSRLGHLLPYEDNLETENIPYEVKILNGYTGQTISKYANEEDVDVVVIGSRGLNALQEMVLGSVSHNVVKKVEAPVLIVK